MASVTAMPIQESTEQLPSWLGGLFGGGASKPAAPAASALGGLGDLAQLFGSGPNSLSAITAQLGIKPGDLAQLGSLIKPGDIAAITSAAAYVDL